MGANSFVLRFLDSVRRARAHRCCMADLHGHLRLPARYDSLQIIDSGSHVQCPQFDRKEVLPTRISSTQIPGLAMQVDVQCITTLFLCAAFAIPSSLGPVGFSVCHTSSSIETTFCNNRDMFNLFNIQQALNSHLSPCLHLQVLHLAWYLL